MKKLNKNILLLGVISAVFFSACSSVKDPENVYEEPDYTLEDVRNTEIKRIEQLLESNNVYALFRASVLGDKETIDKCSGKVKEELKQNLDEKNYFNARRLYSSLVSSGTDCSAFISEKDLNQSCNENVPGLNSVSSKKAVKVSELIKGTVTVWVDKGIKIENGYGYADRVIGSGFFISKDGYIITNNHVIADVVDTKSKNYSRLYIKLAEDSDTRIPAKVIGWDPLVDLALLKAEIDAPYVFNLGSSEELSVGDKIYCIGSPVGLERTLTSGIVSATDRKLFTTGSVLQIDAAVNSGNSGGPCVDVFGNVQAVVFAGMLQFEGLNFAIPVEYLKALLPALYHGGKIVHPWFGCYGHTKKELGKNTGLEVQYILPGSGASRGGLAAGDVITKICGKEVSTLEDIQNILLHNDAKSIIKVEYTRKEEKKECIVFLAGRPESPGYTVYTNDVLSKSFTPLFGLNLVSVSSSNKKKYEIKSVIKGSVGDESGFSENEPLDILGIECNSDKTYIQAQVYSKNRKKGYLDVNMVIAAPLDSPYYF